MVDTVYRTSDWQTFDSMLDACRHEEKMIAREELHYLLPDYPYREIVLSAILEHSQEVSNILGKMNRALMALDEGFDED